MSAAVELDGVTLTYASWGQRVMAVRDLSLMLEPGSWTLVHGSNGSGKSSLLRLIAGEALPDTGTIRLFGRDTRRLSARRRAGLVAYVHQRPDDSLAPGLTIAEHVTACGFGKIHFQSQLEALALGKAFHFLEEAWNRPVDTLSGGERQVLGIVLQLIRPAPLLLLDEAFSALDPRREALVLDALVHMAARATILQVTHQPERFSPNATTVVRMQDGRVVEGSTSPHG